MRLRYKLTRASTSPRSQLFKLLSKNIIRNISIEDHEDHDGFCFGVPIDTMIHRVYFSNIEDGPLPI